MSFDRILHTGFFTAYERFLEVPLDTPSVRNTFQIDALRAEVNAWKTKSHFTTRYLRKTMMEKGKFKYANDITFIDHGKNCMKSYPTEEDHELDVVFEMLIGRELNKMRCPNMVRTYELSPDHRKMINGLIRERTHGQTMGHLLPTLSVEQVHMITKQILWALKMCEPIEFVHYNLSLSNIIISDLNVPHEQDSQNPHNDPDFQDIVNIEDLGNISSEDYKTISYGKLGTMCDATVLVKLVNYNMSSVRGLYRWDQLQYIGLLDPVYFPIHDIWMYVVNGLARSLTHAPHLVNYFLYLGQELCPDIHYSQNAEDMDQETEDESAMCGADGVPVPSADVIPINEKTLSYRHDYLIDRVDAIYERVTAPPVYFRFLR